MRGRQEGTKGGARVLLTGGEHPGGLAALRALRAAGFEPWAAVESRRAAAARSRAAAGVVDVPDPRSEPDDFVEALATASRRIGAAAVLPGTEAAQLAMAGRGDAFPASVAVGDAPARLLRRATDKTALALLSLRAGLNTPRTRILTADGPLGPDAGLSFPAVVKPLRSEISTNGVLRRFEAQRVESRPELDSALHALPDGVGLVQPYIDGQLVGVNGVAWDGELIAVYQHAIERIWPERCGYCIYGKTTPIDEPRRRATAALVKELGWSGIFNMQLIERAGRSYVIDLNPRFYQSLALAEAAGLNLPAIWTSLLLGLPYEAGEGEVGVRFRAEKDDLRAALAKLRRGRPSGLAALLPRRRTVHAHFSVRDPAPLLSVVSDGRAALRRRAEANDSPAATAGAERLAA